jgi:O-antigen ligase
MQSPTPSRVRFRPTLSIGLFAIFLVVLWFAGGASRPDTLGQVAVRGACWGLLVVAAIFSPPLRLEGARPVLFLLVTAAALAALQLVPLPPSIWQALPGRAVLTEAAVVSGQEQPWRPWSMVPRATINALSSLVVPFVALVLVSGMRKGEQDRLPGMMLAFVSANMAIGVLQFSGTAISNPFINDTIGQTAGTFANRNHFALLMAIGCALAPAWAFLDENRLKWRGPVAGGLILLFFLAILASGSRAGLVLGGAGAVIGLVIVARRLRRVIRRESRWGYSALIVGAFAAIIAIVIAGVLTGRTVSVDRILSTDLDQDMRNLGLPTVLRMIADYFPLGTGIGSFDPLFRMHEPFDLLKPTYFNHAHNDWLEILLDTGAAGGLLLATALLWWIWASIQAWRNDAILAKLGSAVTALVMGASVFDYPARTPIIMMVLVIAGVWLSYGSVKNGLALPRKPRHL